ncbi:MAG: hypothetical protein M3X11_06445 [Acidobacteriota bacterium]|nr:hypothetical protein [Acidobacteriota bacterium]
MLKDLVVGLLYLPFLIAPFALLFWYAFVANRRDEAEPVKQAPVKPLDDPSQRPTR